MTSVFADRIEVMTSALIEARLVPEVGPMMASFADVSSLDVARDANPVSIEVKLAPEEVPTMVSSAALIRFI
jgi:hypothetical protein